ncbi:MAG: hypothetical protein GEU93_07290 [Propionibacteriales bacterium]|nr:hypothetical protein [Propionibacteriales bacterium]
MTGPARVAVLVSAPLVILTAFEAVRVVRQVRGVVDEAARKCGIRMNRAEVHDIRRRPADSDCTGSAIHD